MPSYKEYRAKMKYVSIIVQVFRYEHCHRDKHFSAVVGDHKLRLNKSGIYLVGEVSVGYMAGGNKSAGYLFGRGNVRPRCVRIPLVLLC